MRSIDADAIYDELSDIFIEYLATSSNTDTRNALDSLYHTVLSAVETAPTVSPDEVRGVGKWIEDEDQNHVELTFRCSECGRKAVGRFEKTRYCCDCGAKMEVSEDA